jgi:carbamoyltransferase
MEMQDVLAPVLHTDGTARVQTVGGDHQGSLPGILRALKDRNGHAVVLNTSLNVPGKPLACSPRDAVGTFYTSGLDHLYLEGLRLDKERE